MINENAEIPAPTADVPVADVASLPVSSITLKLPPFWPNDPLVWFAQVEAQFHTRNITSQPTKFAYIVSSLQPEIAQEIRDIFLQPPVDRPYDTLKSELIKRTSASEQRRLHQLLISEELGDRKPTQLLRKMRQLLGEQRLEEGILRQLFLQRLPLNAQLILASTADTLPLDQIAATADKILEVAPPAPNISALQQTPPPASVAPPTELATLHTKVEQLTAQVESLVNHLQLQPSRYTRSRSPSLMRRSSLPPLCWYHRRYGNNARKCTPPCSFHNATPNQGNDQTST